MKTIHLSLENMGFDSWLFRSSANLIQSPFQASAGWTTWMHRA